MGYHNLCLIQLPHSDRSSSILFPLGLGYIGMVAMGEGLNVDFFDIHLLQIDKQEVIDRIRKIDCDIIGINAYSTQYAYYKWLVNNVRKILPDVLIVAGGALPTFNSRQILERTKTDICVIGEGEETIREIVRGEYDGYGKISGIAYKDGQDVVFTHARKPIENIDALPFIDHEVFRMDQYIKQIGLFGYPIKRAMNVITSRGCPYDCKFCSKVLNATRKRSIRNIYDEILALKRRYDIDGIAFCDELVITGRKRTLELCAAMKELNVKWGCQCRVNYAPLDLLKEMKKSGCVYVGLGVESGSQKILKNMNKGTTVEQNEKAIKNVLSVGLIPVIQMMYGYPGEDKNTIDETIEMFNRVHYTTPNVFIRPELSLTTALPGSKLYNDCIIEGKIVDEEEYLLKLELGFNSNAPALINFTDFSDSELIENKKMAEQKIYENFWKYLKSNLLARVTFHYFIFKVRLRNLDLFLIDESKKYGILGGLWKTLKKVLCKIGERIGFMNSVISSD